MIQRRELILGVLSSGLVAAAVHGSPINLPSLRPPVGKRAFSSPAAEAELERVAASIGNAKLRQLWINCFPNTLDTTVRIGGTEEAPDTFVITGDIPCMWLRDSACQVRPYLHLARRDPALTRLFRGLLRRQASSILIDPYANAFMEDPRAPTSLEWARDDQTEQRPGVAERKWELDSLLHPIRLAHDYWRMTGDHAPFDEHWQQALRLALATMREQQRLHGDGAYRFQRRALSANDTLTGNGYGAPTRKVGLIHSMFRPSDDACIYPFHVPANLFAVRALRDAARLIEETGGDPTLAAEARALRSELAAALRQHGTIMMPDGQHVLAYEVDGFGNAIFMDDANIPSLSSLSYLQVLSSDDALLSRSAARAWSSANPYFYAGRAASGIGGPHIGQDQIWPMSIIVRGLSSRRPEIVRACLQTLASSDGGTGFMHESFDKDDPSHFTRAWFAWANSLFAELILKIAREDRALLA